VVVLVFVALAPLRLWLRRIRRSEQHQGQILGRRVRSSSWAPTSSDGICSSRAYGARVSLVVSVLATAIGATFGVGPAC
jgi:ABC-type dipeptide/oligopeptide/nickel transport system permease subunit